MTGARERLLSVVVPTKDTRDLTLGCLGSVTAATLPEGTGLEIVVVDDGSSDGTESAVHARFPAARVVRRGRSGGFTIAANEGMAEASGELLLLLNSDAEVEPGALVALVRAFDADPRLGIAGGYLAYPDGTPQWSGGRLPTPLWLFAQATGLPPLLGRLPLYRRLKPVRPASGEVDWVSGAALGVRRAVWNAVGPFDPSFRFYAQDLDLCARAAEGGWRVALVPELRVAHRHGVTIALEAAAVDNHLEPARHWADLLVWAEKHRGPVWSRRCRRAIRAGAGLRVAARLVALPLVSRERRRAWALVTDALAAARRSLEESSGGEGVSRP